MAEYIVASQDCTTPIADNKAVPIVGAGQPVRVITVASLPPAAYGLVFLSIGPNKRPIPLTQQLQRIEIVGEPETEGVFLSCPAGVAATVILAIGVELGRWKNSIDIRP